MKLKTRFTFVLAALALSGPGAVFADADIAVQPAGTPTQATAHVDICVVIPEILIFGVGALGDPIAKIQWDVNPAATTVTGNNQTYNGPAVPVFTAPAPFSAATTATIVSNGGAGANTAGDTANLPVYLFSNHGSDVTITAAVTGGTTGGGTANVLQHTTTAGNTIPIGDFTFGETGTIIHPDPTGTATADTAHTNGIVNQTGFWSYQYAPTTTPVAGTYAARIEYVAAQP